MAFTLIEILVVVCIIAMLAALLFPFLQDARRKANYARCAGNMRQILTGLFLYRADHDGKLVPSGVEEVGNSYNPQPLIETYLGYATPIGDAACMSPVWDCKENPAWKIGERIYYNRRLSYVLNSIVILHDQAGESNRPWRIAEVAHPSKLLLVMERDPLKADGTALGPGLYGYNYITPEENAGYFGHSGGCTVGLADGHVESWPITHDAFMGPNKGRSAFPIYWNPAAE